MREKPGEPRNGDRFGRVVAGSAPVAKAAVGHLMRQALDGPLPGGVQIESNFDERGAFGVRDDVGHLAPTDRFADIEVAEGSLVRVAAELGFLPHALANLARQVGRVELGHQRVDALDQTARGGLVEVLGHRDEGHPAAAQQRADGDVVLHVAGQPVDLVDDDGLDVALLADPRQHGAELWPVGRPGRLALVHVLVHELPALVADAAHARLALGGDREAVLGQVLLGLLLGRDPQVDHATHRPPPLPIDPSDLCPHGRARPSARTSRARATSARANGRSASAEGTEPPVWCPSRGWRGTRSAGSAACGGRAGRATSSPRGWRGSCGGPHSGSGVAARRSVR